MSTNNQILEEERTALEPGISGTGVNYREIADNLRVRNYNREQIEGMRGTMGINPSNLDSLLEAYDNLPQQVLPETQGPTIPTDTSRPAPLMPKDVPEDFKTPEVLRLLEEHPKSSTGIPLDQPMSKDLQAVVDAIHDFKDVAEDWGLTDFFERTEGEEAVEWSKFNLTSFTEKSLVSRSVKYLEKVTDPYYEGPETPESITSQIEELNAQIIEYQNEYGDNNPRAKEVIDGLAQEAFDLVGMRQALKTKESIEKAQEDMGYTDMLKYISTHKEKVAFDLLQGIVDEPDMIVASVGAGAAVGSTVPVVGTAIGGAVGGVSNLGYRGYKAWKTVKRAMVPVAQLGGAYVGGRAEGAFSRALTEASETGELDFMKGWDQAHIDGLLGSTIMGAVQLGTVGFRGTKRAETKAEEFDNFIENTDTKNFDVAKSKFDESQREADTLEQRVQDALAIDNGVPYFDGNGDVVIFKPELDEIPDLSYPDVINLIDKTRSKLSPEKAEALNKSILDETLNRDTLQGMVDDLEVLVSKDQAYLKEPKIMKQLEAKKKELLDSNNLIRGMDKRRVRHDEAVDAYNAVYATGIYKSLDTPDYLPQVNAKGEQVMFKKFDAETDLGKVRIDGFNPDDFSYTADGFRAPNKLDKVIGPLLYRAMNPVQELLPNSKTLQLLKAKLDVDPSNPKLPVFALQEDIRFKQADFHFRYTSLIDGLSKTQGKELQDHLRNVVKSEDPMIVDRATQIRSILDEHFEYMKSSGINMGKIDEHLPRVFSKEVLKTEAGQQVYRDVLLASEGRGRELADDSIKRILLDINERDGILTQAGGSLDKTPYGERSLLKVTDSELATEGLLSENLLEDINTMLMSGVKRAEMAKVYGDGGNKLFSLVKQIADELDEQGVVMSEAQKQNFFDVYNAFNGTHGQIKNKAFEVTQDSLLTMSNLSSLGLAAVTSTVEPILAISRMRTGNIATNTAKVLAVYAKLPHSLLRDIAKYSVESLPADNIFRKTMGKIPEPESYKMAREVGLTTNMSMEMTLDAIQGSGLTTAPLKSLNKAFFMANGLHWITKFSRANAMMMARDDLVTLIGKSMSPKGTNEATKLSRQLMEVNINPKDAKAWHEAGAPQDSRFYKEVILRSASRVADEIIAHPTAANRPTWMSNHKFKLVSQFKGYAVSYSNSILKRAYKDIEAAKKEGGSPALIAEMSKKAFSASVLLTGYYAVGMSKDFVNTMGDPDNRNKQERQEAWAKAALSMTGSPQILMSLSQGLAARNPVDWVASSIAPAPVKAVKAMGNIVKGDVGKAVADTTPFVSNLDPKLRKKVAKKIDKQLK